MERRDDRTGHKGELELHCIGKEWDRATHEATRGLPTPTSPEPREQGWGAASGFWEARKGQTFWGTTKHIVNRRQDCFSGHPHK